MRKVIPCLVDPLDHLSLRVEDCEAGDGPEYLVLAALVIVRQASDDSRRYEVSLRTTVGSLSSLEILIFNVSGHTSQVTGHSISIVGLSASLIVSH